MKLPKKKFKGDFIISRNTNNYILISSPKPPLTTSSKYFPGDVILEYNNKKTSDLSDDEVKNIFRYDYPDDQIGKKFNLKILRNGNVILISDTIKNYEYYDTYITLKLIEKKLNIPNNTFTSRTYIEIKQWYLNIGKIVKKYFEKNDGCIYTDDEINIMQLPRVDEGIEFPNSKIINKDNFIREHHIMYDYTINQERLHQ